jgi:hypothetical protein
VFKFQFRPMIGSPRSTCTFYHLKGTELAIARYTCRRGSTKGTVEASKSCPCLGGMCTLSLHSFYPPYRNRS